MCHGACLFADTVYDYVSVLLLQHATRSMGNRPTLVSKPPRQPHVFAQSTHTKGSAAYVEFSYASCAIWAIIEVTTLGVGVLTCMGWLTKLDCNNWRMHTGMPLLMTEAATGAHLLLVIPPPPPPAAAAGTQLALQAP